MELRDFRYFVAVAEELNFHRAARRLHMAQPPLSQQIKHLEAEVGATLLRRSTRKVELTAAGEVFLERARRILREAEAARETAGRTARGELGKLIVGFVDSASFDLLPRIFGAFREQRPEVALELRELGTEQQLAALGEELDVAVVREVDDLAGIIRTPLLQEPLLAALPPDHELANRPWLALADLATAGFIFFPRSRVPRVHDHLTALCRRAGFTPHVAQEALQYPTMTGLVASGFGVALVPACVQAFCRSRVSYVPISDAEATSQLSLVARQDSDSAALETFWSAATALAAQGSATRSSEAAPVDDQTDAPAAGLGEGKLVDQ
jgi:DNA-binding transcriptional LysR family regulator